MRSDRSCRVRFQETDIYTAVHVTSAQGTLGYRLYAFSTATAERCPLHQYFLNYDAYIHEVSHISSRCR